MPRRLLALALLVLASLALASCGGGDSEGGATTVEGFRVLEVIELRMSEFELTPREIPVERGAFYGIRAINDGEEPHRLAIRGPEVNRRTATVAPGESATIAVHLQRDGTYDLWCPLGDHEERGMKAALTLR